MAFLSSSVPPMLVYFLSLAAALLSGCGMLITPQKEVEIGKGVDQELRKQYRMVDGGDPVAGWAKEFVEPLQKGSTAFRNPNEIGGFKVSVIADDKLVNAFSPLGVR